MAFFQKSGADCKIIGFFSYRASISYVKKDNRLGTTHMSPTWFSDL